MSFHGYPIVFGTLEQEASFPHYFSGEKCSLSGAVGIDEAARYAHLGLALQIHRGEQGSGIVSYDGSSFREEKTTGRLTDLIRSQQNIVDFTPGRIAISHGRYATSGDPNDDKNVQPIHFEEYGGFWLAHNGNLSDQDDLRSYLKSKGRTEFKSTSDSELFGHVIATSGKDTLEDAIAFACEKVPAAYSHLIMNDKQIFAVRDRYGVRPLSYGNMGKGHFVSSENYFYDKLTPNVRNEKEVPRGGYVVLEEGKPPREVIVNNTSSEYFCAFELLYFSSAHTRMGGEYGYNVRNQLGRQMQKEIEKLNCEPRNTLVVPILNSGRHFAKGLAEGLLGVEYDEAIERIQSTGLTDLRSFTSTSDRSQLLLLKHLVMEDRVKGRDIILGDDTICRGSTSKEIVKMVREAGARSVHFMISGAPIIDGCPYGINLKGTKNGNSELIFNIAPSEDEVARLIGADSVTYQKIEDLESLLKERIGKNVCLGCMGGRDPLRKPD